MRFVRFVEGARTSPRVGVIDGEMVRPLIHPNDVLTAIADGFVLAGASDSIRLGDVTALSPIENPPSLRDFISFEQHARNANKALGKELSDVWYEQPAFFFSNPAAVVGPEDSVAISPGSDAFDYEVEIAAVIGRAGSNIAVSDAESHIAGYTLFCDWSARDLQERETRVGLGPAKGKDSATTLGPFLVTLDELEKYRLGNGYDVTFTVFVNGIERGRGNWSSIHWTFAQMISYASRGTTLRPGDVIGGGTVAGCSILEHAGAYPYLAEGDVVHIDGGPLGTITQIVIAGAELVSL